VLSKVITVISKNLFNGWMLLIFGVLVLLAAIIGIAFYVNGRHSAEESEDDENHDNRLYKCREILPYGVLAVALCYILTVAKVAPYQEARYYMCIFPLLCMSVCGIMYKLLNILLRRKIVARGLTIAVVAVILVLSHQMQTVGYSYTDHQGRADALEPYAGATVLVYNGAGHNSSPERWIFEYVNYSDVFVGRSREYECFARAAEEKDLTKGFLLYANSMSINDEAELFENIGEYIDIANYELVTGIGCPVYYCTVAENNTGN